MCSLVLTACSGGETTSGLDVPRFETSHVLLGTAAQGRSIPPGSLQVRALADLSEISPEQIFGTNVDMVVAGLDAADLPEALEPEELLFVTARQANSRPLPPLRETHVLLRPSPPDAPSPLVAVEDPDASRDSRAERAARLDVLLDDVGIAAPCVAPTQPFSVTTARTSADIVRVLHPLSDGSTVVGFAITSTVILGVVRPGANDIDLVTVPIEQGVLREGEASEVRWFSDDEVEFEGRRLPAAFTFDIAEGFGSAGVYLVWSAARARYVVETPITDASAPRSLAGVARIDLDGTPHECAYGSAIGSERTADLWCRTTTSTAWSQTASVMRAFGFTGILPSPDGRHLATDLAGTVYTYTGQQRWSPVLETSLNAGCDPLCAAFSTFTAGDDGALAGVIAGAKAQLLLLERGGSGVTARRPEVLDRALFADERPDAEDPLRISAMDIAPDGALWFADTSPNLFRYDPSTEDLRRVCLPEALHQIPIAAIHAHADGRLLLGTKPAYLAVGDWR